MIARRIHVEAALCLEDEQRGKMTDMERLQEHEELRLLRTRTENRQARAGRHAQTSSR
ncbi:hypothetical protein [Burkholderia vietnamiensis]|uniref:hypothetical protein n=1 Tax=Burkholderia vietnamiensis TaxID=60552 RepID=UPI001CABF243|nr:hypothetical protein [Burkholderia vietnamiensis]CAG9228694.1 hypothetical protein BVI1335_70080 [Burkholderia vietnamiensis]HDR9086385.1 hypothetical protein [Burkholderia vietnamiensis]